MNTKQTNPKYMDDEMPDEVPVDFVPSYKLAVTDLGNAPSYPQFSICRNGSRTQLITVTKKGRFGDVLANVLTGYEGNIREALNACERGETAEAIRIFTNRA